MGVSSIISNIYNISPERVQGNSSEFKMLETKWDPYNSNAKEQSEKCMSEGYPYPSAEKPQKIHQYVEAPGGS
jgi:hypothetical protein